MKGRENSMPEKKRMKPRWVKFRRKCEFVRTNGLAGFVFATLVVPLSMIPFGWALVLLPFTLFSVDELSFAEATLLGRVSGKQK